MVFRKKSLAQQPPWESRLGIQLFEGNPDVIENAADRQMAHVRSSAIGPRAQLSQQILNEIATARVCLLNSASKATYDQQLAMPSSPPPPERNASPGRDDVATPLSSYAPRKKRVVKNAPSPVPKILMIVVGGIAGLAFAAFLLHQIREQEEKRAREAVRRSQAFVPPRQRSVNPRRPSATASPRPKRNEQQLTPAMPPLQRSPPSVPGPNPAPAAAPKVNPIRPPPEAEPSPRSTNSLAETSVTEREPPPSFDLSSLPADVDLPPISAREAELLTWTAIPEDLEIKLTSDLITLDTAYAFVAKKDSSSPPAHWQIYLQKTLDVGTQQEVVADLTSGDHGLTFRWTDNASKLPAGQLRNCLMQLTSGSESHQVALRSPLRPKSARLPAETDKFKATFDVEDHPWPECLRLDVEVSYDGSKIASESGTETTTKGKRLHFKIKELLDVEIQVTLLSQKDKSLTLQALPKHQLSKSRQLTLSTEEVDEFERRILKSILRSQKDLVKANNALRTARTALSRASSSAARAVQNRIVENKTKEIANNPKKIAEMRTSLNSVGQLRSLVSAVRLNTLVRYRIYAESKGSRLLLVDGEYDASRPAPKDRPVRNP